jgi:hypothetical protein
MSPSLKFRQKLTIKSLEEAFNLNLAGDFSPKQEGDYNDPATGFLCSKSGKLPSNSRED